MHRSFLLLAIATLYPCFGQLNLPDRRDYQIPAGAQYIVHGDFNNDGIPDIAVTVGSLSGFVSVLLGNGDGTFQPPINTHAGLYPSGLAAADFNNDGKLDLVVLPFDSMNGTFELLLGNGDGTFQTPQQVAIPTSGTCWYVVAADLNHDNEPDLIFAYAGLNEVIVLLGNGDGTFRTPEILEGGAYFTLGDFNNDGNLDIATSRSLYSLFFSVLLGNGDGTFQPPIVNKYRGAPFASGDLNGDGVPDLVLSYDAEYYSIALGNGDGTFQQPIPTPYRAEPPFEGIVPALADLDGDGRPDLIILTQLDPDGSGECCSVSVLKGNGDGTFAVPKDFQVGLFDSVAIVTAITVADFNGDGRPDIAVPGGTVSVLLNAPLPGGTVNFSDPLDRVSYGARGAGKAPASIASGKFDTSASPASFPDLAVISNATNQVFVIPVSDGLPGTPHAFAAGTSPVAVVVADLNHDENLDLITANSGSDDVSVLLGDGHGGFATASSFPAGGSPSALTVGDFNHDGNADLAVADAQASSVTILLGNGAGGFSSPFTVPTVANPDSITVADFNHDGIPDLAVGSSTAATISILIGTGNGTFMPGPALAAPDSVTALASAIFRAGGTADLVITAGGHVYVALGNGDGTFQAWTQHLVPPGPSSIGIGDFNGDGHLDFITSNSSSNDVSVFLGDGEGHFSASIDFGADYSALALTAADFRNNGKLDVAVSNPIDNRVTILLNPFQR